MFFTVAITVYDKDQIFLPRAVTGLLTQSFQDFEVIIVVDGEAPLSPYDPHKVCSKVLPAQVVYRPRSNTIGFRERHYALQLARGEYIVWLNVDNLVYLNWLLNHHANVCKDRGVVSVVNIHYWRLQDYWGILPTALAHGEMDLLNYALPLELARKLDVFGPDVEHIPHADWIAFERCSREARVVWHREQPVCACHL
jgi:hypothetical protein